MFQLPSPDPSAFSLDLDMELFPGQTASGGGGPASPSAQLVPDGRLSPSNVDDLSQAVLDDLLRSDTRYDDLGKCVNPVAPTTSLPQPQQQPQMSSGVPAHAFFGGVGGGARAMPSPFSAASESGSDFGGRSSHDLPPMIKNEDLLLLSQPPRATMASPDQADEKALAEYIGSIFPKAALRSSKEEWKVFRSKVTGLTKPERKMVATLRRKELSCVYAEKARQSRIKKMRTSGEDNRKLRALLDKKDSRIASLEKQLAALQKQAGGRR